MQHATSSPSWPKWGEVSEAKGHTRGRRRKSRRLTGVRQDSANLLPLPCYQTLPSTVRDTAPSLVVKASATNGQATNGKPRTGLDVDVGNVCVEPVYRSVPRPKESDKERVQVRVLFLSEGGVCRSVIAEAVFREMVKRKGLEEFITCESKAVRDYNEGEGPEPLAVQLCAQCGINLDQSSTSRVFVPAEDIVDFDILLVFDKFNAADVLKEVSVYDTIDPTLRLSSRVRRLGDFSTSSVVADIDDPLYGNMGGPEELERLSETVTDIEGSCEGLMEQLVALRNTSSGAVNLRDALGAWLKDQADMDWLVPPMLQKRGPG